MRPLGPAVARTVDGAPQQCLDNETIESMTNMVSETERSEYLRTCGRQATSRHSETRSGEAIESNSPLRYASTTIRGGLSGSA